MSIPGTTARAVRRHVLGQMAAGVGIISLPVSAWWYWSQQERQKIQERERTKVQLPISISDTYDYLIAEKCQVGDVVLFDRRCERCCASPWSALSCYVAKWALTNRTISDRNIRSIDTGRYDHIGIIVPGYVREKKDAFEDTNMLLMEATPSGIVARPLKERLEQSASQSVLLLQLCSPGEQRNLMDAVDTNTGMGNEKATTTTTTITGASTQKSVARMRQHVERELTKFRDTYIAAGVENRYKYLHSTVTMGGALAYKVGLQDWITSYEGPVNPAAFLVLTGLHQAAAAPALSDRETRAVKPEDYLRDYRFTEKDAVRLRPGWRFLAPIPLKQSGNR